MAGKSKYKLKVLTPVHVGNGKNLMPLECSLNLSGKQVLRIDMDAFFKDKSFAPYLEKFISEANSNKYALDRNFNRLALNHVWYKLDARDTIADLNRFTGRNTSNILEHIKEGGEAYIPGSSLKGALRGMLFRWLVKEKRNVFAEELSRSVEARKKEKELCLNSERKFLGDTRQSLLRALQAGDSSLVDPSSLMLGCVRVMSQNQGGYYWKTLGNNRDNNEDGTPVFFEALAPDTELQGTLKMDGFLLQEETAMMLGYRKEQREALGRLAQICNAGAQELLKEEHRFFTELISKEKNALKKNRLQSVVKSIEALQKEAGNCKEGEFLLSLAWGTGYNAKALGGLLDRKFFEEIREKYRLGRLGAVFPKSRKIFFKDGKPAGLPGWVKITLEN